MSHPTFDTSNPDLTFKGHPQDEAIDPQKRCTQEYLKYDFEKPKLYSSAHSSSSTPLPGVMVIQIP